MKKTFLSILLCLYTLFVVSCDKDDNNKGVEPTEEFTVNESIQNNAVYQGESTLVISGKGQKGINLVVDLINDNNKVEDSYDVQINQNNEWKLSIQTPDSSFNEYQIKIYDEYKKYEKMFSNIKFGEVIMLIGEEISKSNQTIDENSELDFLSYYIVSNNDSKWIDFEEDIYTPDLYSYELAKNMSKKYECPIGIIVNYADAKLYEWLDKDTIDSVSPIKKYLEKNSLYEETPSKEGDMSYLAMNRLEKLSDLSISKIVWNHGISELSSFADNTYVNVYFQMLMTLMDNLIMMFDNSKIAIVEAGSFEQEEVINLRRVQEYIGNYYTNVKLIPTFDLNNNIKVEVKRIISILDEGSRVSQYSNLFVEVDESMKVVTSIKIEINNTDNLIIESENKNKIIKYFNIYYNDKDKGTIKLDILPIIDENLIIINLKYKEEIKDEDTGEIKEVVNVYDKNLISIEYGINSDLNDVNLFNDDNLPILPFIILFD